jgi:hypothetical protein
MQGIIAAGAFFLLSGLYTAHRANTHRLNFKRGQDWPMAEGMVTSSEYGRNENGVWAAEIWYSYRVDGEEFESSVVNADSEMNVGYTDKYARARAEKYPEGSPVLVHYAPDDPQMAFLETKGSKSSAIWIGAGLLQVAMALVLIASGLVGP